MRLAQRLAVLTAAALGLLALAMPGLAAARDRNHDRIPDRWEKRHHLSLRVNQARRDQDRDRLRNRAEFLAGDNPRRADSDGDGIPDGEENAGTVRSFDPATGRLVIGLFGEETVSGLVNEETEIKCEHRHTGASASSEDGESAEEGDRQGEEEPGDDHGSQAGDDDGEESGDDDSNPETPSSESGEGEGEAACTTADLVPGAIVHQAELKIEQGAAIFEEVELAG